MTIRAFILRSAGAILLVSGCTEQETGPVKVTAIGGAPVIANPNIALLDPPSAFLVEGVAQGLVRFDSEGEIEPALAQSWIVSDDGLRYTFRIRRTRWPAGGRVTAQQVVARLRATLSPASSNPLKPILGLIAEIEPMTDEVLEIALRAPRPNFLQLLAQPEMAILLENAGTGPYRAEPQPDGSVLMSLPSSDDESVAEEAVEPPIALRGERASLAVARFVEGETDLVTGGTAGDLPVVRAAELPAATLRFDPVAGLFGLVFQRSQGPLGGPAARHALSMAVDRNAIMTALAVPAILPRATLLPSGLEEVPQPAAADWAGLPLATRRQLAARAFSTPAGEAFGAAGNEPIRVRVAIPDGPGYRLIFAFLRRDWRAIGVEAERVAPDADADLRFVDAVAPATMAAWYLRHFTCDRSAVCDPAADEALAAARQVRSPIDRRNLLAKADSLLSNLGVFVPIGTPVRWSLASPRLTGFRPNLFGRHPPGELIAAVR